MARKSGYVVQHAFSATGKSGKSVWITRGKQEKISTLLSESDIKKHVKAGNLIERGSVDSTTAVVEAAAPAPKKTARKTTRKSTKKTA